LWAKVLVVKVLVLEIKVLTTSLPVAGNYAGLPALINFYGKFEIFARIEKVTFYFFFSESNKYFGKIRVS